jgi:membrane protein DedA with SNARE-associated domain
LPVASFTSLVGDHGIYAVFALMAAAAVVPAASELVMVYAGAVASGAFASAHVVLFGHRVETPAWAYVTMAVAGVLGNLVGAVGGWIVGAYGGRPFVERYGRWLHVTPARLERAERWFDRFGAVAVPLGFAAPVVRSFVAIPAGMFRIGLGRFLPAAALGSAAFCFGLAGGGWALGRSYDSLHSGLQDAGIAIVAVVALVAALAIWRVRRSSRLSRRAGDPAR